MMFMGLKRKLKIKEKKDNGTRHNVLLGMWN